MKTNSFSPLLLTALFTACDPDDDSNIVNPTSNQALGKWTVTYYWDKDKEETSDFNGYVFDFQDDGILVATTASNTYNGTWLKNDSSNKLIINIQGAYPLDEMTDDWLIMEMSGNSIKLKDDNSEHLEELHLKKQ